MNPFLTTGTRYYRVLVLGPVITGFWYWDPLLTVFGTVLDPLLTVFGDCPGPVYRTVWDPCNGLSGTRVPRCFEGIAWVCGVLRTYDSWGFLGHPRTR